MERRSLSQVPGQEQVIQNEQIRRYAPCEQRRLLPGAGQTVARELHVRLDIAHTKSRQRDPLARAQAQKGALHQA